jgi:hypothetical protein
MRKTYNMDSPEQAPRKPETFVEEIPEKKAV